MPEFRPNYSVLTRGDALKSRRNRWFVDSPLEGDGFELPGREHRAMAPSHAFAAASHPLKRRSAGRPPLMARPRSEAQRGSVRPAAAMRSTHREMRCSAAVQIHIADARRFGVARKPGREELLKRLRTFRGRLPADFKFDRDEANAR